MNVLWQSALSNAVLATMLAAGVAVVCRFIRRPALVHGLWLLVIVKLLTPPILPLSIGGVSWLGGLATWPGWTLSAGDGFMGPLVLVLAGAWLAGRIVVTAVTIWRISQFQRLLAMAHPAPERLQRKVEAMAQRLGLTEMPTVWLIPGPLPPLVWSVGPVPRVYLPTDLLCRLPAAQRGTLLAHELAHLVRGDHLIRWVEAAATIAFWWHPIAWLAGRELREAEEQCCDAWVVQAYPRASREYADALLETIDFLAEPQPVLAAAASGVSRIHDLETRLVMVMEGTAGKTLSRRDWWTLVTATALALPLGLVVASGQSAPIAADQLPAARSTEHSSNSQRVTNEAPFGDDARR